MNLLVCLLILLLAAPSLQSELKILSTPDGKPHPLPCALTCTGVSKFDDPTPYTRWRSHFKKAWKYVGIKECGFVAPPIVTATVEGSLCPAIKIWGVQSDNVAVVSVQDASVSHMVDSTCDVHWTAHGYNC